jgi:ketosteroid isomerase-like protein
MERSVPILPGDDLRIAKDYYVGKLGFTVLWEDTADGTSGIMGIEKGTIELTIDCPMSGHGREACVSLRVKSADDYYDEWRRAVTIEHPPRDETWGARTFSVIDPFGNTLFVIGPQPGTPSEETAADRIVALERTALDRWNNGDPSGFLEAYADDVTYFDPVTPARIDGHAAMADYYRPWTGKIDVPRYDMLNPRVIVDGNMALLTYNLVNYARDASGVEAPDSRWNSTTVYQLRGDAWKAVHSHWSFTRHPALQELAAGESERQGEQR